MCYLILLAIAGAALWFAVRKVKAESPDGTVSGGVKRIFRLR